MADEARPFALVGLKVVHHTTAVPQQFRDLRARQPLIAPFRLLREPHGG